MTNKISLLRYKRNKSLKLLQLQVKFINKSSVVTVSSSRIAAFPVNVHFKILFFGWPTKYPYDDTAKEKTIDQIIWNRSSFLSDTPGRLFVSNNQSFADRVMCCDGFFLVLIVETGDHRPPACCGQLIQRTDRIDFLYFFLECQTCFFRSFFLFFSYRTMAS